MANHIKPRVLVLLATAIAFAGGCASYIGHVGLVQLFPVTGPYPGVRCDVYVIDMALKEEKDDPAMIPGVILIGLVELPCSFALDTVLLPIDLVRWPFKEKAVAEQPDTIIRETEQRSYRCSVERTPVEQTTTTNMVKNESDWRSIDHMAIQEAADRKAVLDAIDNRSTRPTGVR
jgi:uncharacterized protein YceK